MKYTSKEKQLIKEQFKIDIYDKLEFYQKKNVKIALESIPKHYLAYDMGLGKSIVALSIHFYNWLNAELDKPILIICPAYIKQTFADEIENWFKPLFGKWYKNRLSKLVKVVENKPLSQNAEEQLVDAMFVIINYEQAHKLVDYKLAFSSVIIDEAHYINNMSSNRSKAVDTLIYNKPFYRARSVGEPNYKFISLLSGTPINKSAEDFVHALKLLDKFNMFAPNLQNFKDKWCHKLYDKFSKGGYKYIGIANPDEWKHKLSEFCFFADKSIIADKLVGKKRHKIVVNLTNKSEYNRAENDFKQFLKEYKLTQNKLNFQDKTRITELNNISNSKYITLQKLSTTGKIKNTIQYIKDLIKSGQKFVLVVSYHSSIELLNCQLKKEKYISNNSYYNIITGQTNIKKRHEIINQFRDNYSNNDKHNFVIATIKSISTGINLSFCDRLIVLESCLEYYHLLQLEDRLYRRGQKKLANIDYLISNSDIENKIYSNIAKSLDNYNNFILSDKPIDIKEILE